jgi:ubiquinone/menaquinone biosynthesis C-methylase UbiE
MPSNVYASTHDPATIRTHEWRTVSNSAAYLIPHLNPNLHVLDVGCGPGSITIDLATNYVPQGSVVGLEYSAKPLVHAQSNLDAAAAETGKSIENVRFVQGDVLDLKAFADDTFDVVHAHQVLQHVPDPVRALAEMRRVVKPDGIIASRESASMTWYPKLPELETWYNSIYLKVGKDLLGGNPDPGSYIHVWAQKAGFERSSIRCSAGTWCFSSPEERHWWGGIWAERLLDGDYVDKVVDRGGYCSREELGRIAGAFKTWAESEDGWFTVMHGEMICRK